MATPQERIAAGQELRRRGKLNAQQEAALQELEKRYGMGQAPAPSMRGTEQFPPQQGLGDMGLPEPTPRPRMSRLEAARIGAAQGRELSLADEARGMRAMAGIPEGVNQAYQAINPLGRFANVGLGLAGLAGEAAGEMPESYTQARDIERARLAQAREDRPAIAYGSELLQSVAYPGGAYRPGAPLATQMLNIGRVGAGQGAFLGYAASEGDTGERLQSAALGGVLGGTVGAATPAVGAAALPVYRAVTKASAKAIDAVVGMFGGKPKLTETVTRRIAEAKTRRATERAAYEAEKAISKKSKSARGRTARDEAIDLLLAKGFDPDEAEKLVKLISYDRYTSVDEMLFELANADIDQLAVAVARVGGDAKKTFREAFRARNIEMPERIRTQLRDAMALSGEDLEDFAGQMAKRAEEASSLGYATAYSNQVSDKTWGAMWDSLSASPDAIDALTAGARLARNSYRKNPDQLAAAGELTKLAEYLSAPTGPLEVPPKLSTRALDYLDRGFNFLIAGQKKQNKAYASSLLEIRNTLREAGLDADTALSVPRRIYSQYKAAGRAMDFGAKAFGRSVPLRDIKKQFANSLDEADEVFEDITGEGRSVVDQALVMGWLRGAEDAIETATNPGALIRQIYGSERQRAKLLEMMPEETDVMTAGQRADQTKRIKALVGSALGKEDYDFAFTLSSGARAEGRQAVPSLFERQRRMLESQARVSGNSVTGEVNEAIAAQGGLQRGAEILARTIMEPQQAAQNAILWAVQRTTTPAIFKPGVNRELGRILTTRGREQLLDIIGEIRARKAATGKGQAPPSGSPPTPPPRGGGKGPKGKSKVGTRAADVAAVGAIASGSKAQAQEDNVSPEMQAAQSRTKEAVQRVTNAENNIRKLQADLDLIEDPNADPRSLQELLKRRGYYQGPIDGIIGPDSIKAIDDNRKLIRQDMEKERAERKEALKELEASRKGEVDAQMLESLEKAKVSPYVQVATDLIKGAAFIGGIYAAGRFRKGAVKEYSAAARTAARKANELINPNRLRDAQTGPNSTNVRAANLNEFYKMGGAGKKVPFTADDQGNWSARANVKEASQLFKAPRFIDRDQKFLLAAGVESQASKQIADEFKEEREKAEAEMQKAYEAGDPVSFNRAVMNRNLASSGEVFFRILERLGYGLLAGGAMAGLKKYPAVNANVKGAEAERALILQGLQKQKAVNPKSASVNKKPK